jgi:hypothetical protein
MHPNPHVCMHPSLQPTNHRCAASAWSSRATRPGSRTTTARSWTAPGPATTRKRASLCASPTPAPVSGKTWWGVRLGNPYAQSPLIPPLHSPSLSTPPGTYPGEFLLLLSLWKVTRPTACRKICNRNHTADSLLLQPQPINTATSAGAAMTRTTLTFLSGPGRSWPTRSGV